MAKKTIQPAPKTFEEALAELESILKQIEAGSLGLEDSLTKYERGNFLIQHCRGVLSTAEKQIELISGSAEAGVRTTTMAREMDEDDENDEDDKP
ncbi:exodeoxyribonuclease VII small subunit [Humisphaera borealis]|uniref:Exodeoxyribonuclease 7 small subunit n=1 Tax=Humisphaera borealis TaxID=2807512 RepID=A0A7M2WU00_9BACT|nr:exodeoxyribonuclease VII small subunit [Humisphaera borealis]QOV88988.1 exodeoxyribonuclease VII small subunit [Humisphaera borealis]